MSTKTILITDTKFVMGGSMQEAALLKKGFRINRITKFPISEADLVTAIQEVDGYILGGIEKVTSPVINSAKKLKVIAFTGSGYTEYIPAYEEATAKGIAISTAKGENAQSVAEFTMGLVFRMIRAGMEDTAQISIADWKKNRELKGLTLGIIGYGTIGKIVRRIAGVIGLDVKIYTRDKLNAKNAKFVSLEELVETADIVSLHVNKEHGKNVLSRSYLAKMKDGSIVINAAFPEAVDLMALYEELANARLRAAFDKPPQGKDYEVITGFYENLRMGDPQSKVYYASSSQVAWDTVQANNRVSESVTRSLINLLETGKDRNLVNRKYSRFSKARK